MLDRLPYLSLSEAADYCNCTVSQLLRVAEMGADQLELQYSVDYENMGFGPETISTEDGDTEHFLAIPCTHIKELIHKGQTTVQTFLVSETAGRTANMLDILLRLSSSGDRESIKEIQCKSSWIVKQEDLYITRESLDRICHKSEKISSGQPTYLTLNEAADLYGKTVNQILMEGTKGADNLEILYWVSYREVHRDNIYRQFEGLSVAGDYLVLPKERIVELRHQGQTTTDCYYYPTRSPMHEGMEQIRREKRLRSGNSWKRGKEFIRCETTIMIIRDDNNLVVTTTDLDRIWPRSDKQGKNNTSLVSGFMPEKSVKVDTSRNYPTEMQVLLEAEKRFTTAEGITKPASIIRKWIKDRLQDKGVDNVKDNTSKRIAQLITCDEAAIAQDAWENVYGQNSKRSQRIWSNISRKHLV